MDSAVETELAGPPCDARAMSAAVRRWVIEQAAAARGRHVGSRPSVVEVLAALWGGVMRDPGTDPPDRDRFLLAKGHAALALYGVLRWRGLITPSLFATYCQDGSPLGVHPERGLPGVEVSTGSLGQ